MTCPKNSFEFWGFSQTQVYVPGIKPLLLTVLQPDDQGALFVDTPGYALPGFLPGIDADRSLRDQGTAVPFPAYGLVPLPLRFPIKFLGLI